jgi:2-methylcitrate dehydratase PrpD
MLLGMQMGFNARAALTAVDLAARGLAGPREVLEGRYGYFKLFEGAWDLAPVLAELGRVWRVSQLAHKPFPSGRLTHGAVDGLLRLTTTYGFQAEDIAGVAAIVPPLVKRLVGRPAIPAPTANYARLCLAFVAATALLRGDVDVPDFIGDRLADPAVHALAQKVELAVDDNLDENAVVPQTIQVALTDGRRYEIRLESVLGHPESPLTRERHLGKFRRCWTYGARRLSEAKCDRLIALVDHLEEVTDVRDLTALTAPEETRHG